MIEDHHTRNGLWRDVGVPKSAWLCRDMRDAGEDGPKCCMCGGPQVRYLHVLFHSDFPRPLEVGTECAQLLEGDFDRPRRRVEAFRLESRIRREWPGQRWRLSSEGNFYVITRGFVITTFQKGPGYGLSVRREKTFNRDDGRSGRKMYPTLDAAKAAGLDVLFWARDNLAVGADFENWRSFC